MNPLLSEALASIVRHILTIGAGYLVASGVWSDADATRFVGAAALALVGIGWALYQKYVARVQLETAVTMANTTEEKVRIAARGRNPL